MKSKRGVSPLIATVLIIGFTIVLAAVVMQWGGAFVRSLTATTASSAEVQIKCTEMDFDVKATVLTQTIQVTNNKDITISDVLIQKINTAGSTNLVIPVESVGEAGTAQNIGPFASKSYRTFELVNLEPGTFVATDKIRVIPYVTLDNNEEKGCPATVAVEIIAS